MRNLLTRYRKDNRGNLLIEVTVDKIEDLYNDFDRNAPFRKRDLDQEFVDYLIDCAEELLTEKYIILFSVKDKPDEYKQSRIIKSIDNYFHYLVELEKKGIRQMMFRAFVLFVIGLVILVCSVLLAKKIQNSNNLVLDIVNQGLTVAAWVSLWESIATFLLEWAPKLKKIKIFKRVIESKFIFNEFTTHSSS